MKSVITVYPPAMRDAWIVQTALGILKIDERHFDTLELATAMMESSDKRKIPKTVLVEGQSIIHSNGDGNLFLSTCQQLGISVLGLVRDGQTTLPWGEPTHISNLHLRLNNRK